MYSTCISCHAPLGANEALERFPVGRRLAFDQATGRLWVVCGLCRQWNLSPLEERWEAIEEGERLYRDTRLRAATDNIGLARMPDGTELIRIGRPLRPEFAAWRYGDRFRQRWAVRGRVAAAAGGVAVLAKGLGSFALLFQVTAVPVAAVGIASAVATAVHHRRRVLDLRLPTGRRAALTQAHVETLRIVADPDDALGWHVRVKHRPLEGHRVAFHGLDPEVTFRGDAARDVAARLLPRLNRGGGAQRIVDDAVRILDQAGSPEAVFRLAAVHDPDSVSLRRRGSARQEAEAVPDDDDPLAHASHFARVRVPLKLAVEMAAHEDVERAALAGELAALHARWKEADEIAAIADGLTLPPAVLAQLERLRLR